MLLVKLLLRPITGRAAYLIVVFGLCLISPSLTVDLLNLLLAKINAGQLPEYESMPILGFIIFLVGASLIIINHIWVPGHNRKEVIGIRHNSLGAFPQEDVRKDLPLLHRLEPYREIDVDHSDSYTHGILTDHQSVIRKLERVPQQLSGFLDSSPDSSIAYYGLPHIPLAFYLGYLLSDSKYRVDLYDFNNESGRWNQLSGVAGSIEIDSALDQIPSSDDSGDIIVAIGISYPVHASEVNELGLSYILATVEINALHPMRQLIVNRHQVDQVCNEFRLSLEKIKNNFPNRQRIHVFYAGPVSLCFALGRCINERIDPEIIVYNYSSKSKPRYSWSLSMNSSNHATAAFNLAGLTGREHAPIQHA
ncbi:MAG: SAVED domain-containing protein [Saccharospirillum sp.]|uniref:SAVED domain-containing protein n=1 Tax=Saccharospirillum sp. TaxID=2033801 RepID=UPI003299A012